MSFDAADARHMARALELARRGLYTTDPNPRVGCVIVRDGRVVGEGWHARAGEAHAEVVALHAAGERARGADVYLTLEPCAHHGKTPPCVDALIGARVARVVAAMRDPNPRVDGGGFAALQGAGIRWAVGLLEDQARALNPGFVLRMAHGRPFVRVKLAASLDGRTALASGESRWITGEAARADVQRLRARSSAILTGVDTVLADDPVLNVRAFEIGRQPIRVVLDSRLRTPPQARLFRPPGKTWLIAVAAEPEARRAIERSGAEVVLSAADAGGRVELAGALRLLADREINEVLVEAGRTLCGSLVEAGLVDELVLYFAPHLLGDGARGLFHLPGIARLSDRIALDIADVRAVGQDWRIVAKPVYPT
ncbi:diaminohydroxyphosphoribosylaminopyrimidine deaminase [Sulfurifustis variabilis]|uniref:Riboflavin biosynthesis protein RibD n=1 Tax=Sulfurifustis variabilis TaxID=1675686 RepID=A0A1B4V551_9GAMM|nr:bifunctional diaminohydroxyphosphoribosylaminopyrimidine deaminase/5-amino-6-(5-phosphoribosylamino)uracil reductase RibD [Sulfurifustis variabilis]BAU48660.1 diaminohydroxyphosphoribosylaminopyrimidine deaminase [Sulfurifustis variabilis]